MCKKLCFYTKEDAQYQIDNQVRKAETEHIGQFKAMIPYFCDYHNAWHMGHKPGASVELEKMPRKKRCEVCKCLMTRGKYGNYCANCKTTFVISTPPLRGAVDKENTHEEIKTFKKERSGCLSSRPDVSG